MDEEDLEYVKGRLCYYDPRNPDFIGADEDRKYPVDWCSCDNCFYGRTKLAEMFLDYIEETEELQKLVLIMDLPNPDKRVDKYTIDKMIEQHNKSKQNG